MTFDEVRQLVERAFVDAGVRVDGTFCVDGAILAVTRAVAAEREACARVADDAKVADRLMDDAEWGACDRIARAIRARGAGSGVVLLYPDPGGVTIRGGGGGGGGPRPV